MLSRLIHRCRSGLSIAFVVATATGAFAQGLRAGTVGPNAAPAAVVLEIRSYNLKPGTRGRFHQRFENEALPMLQRWKVDVVAYGPSLHDDDSWFLMRAYSSVEDRQRSEDAFYGSDEWKRGPREAILADIESYTTIVIRVNEATLQGLRVSHR